MRPPTDEAVRLALTAHALAAPARVEIALHVARTGPAEVRALAEWLHMSHSAVSKHLAIMREAGLLDAEQRGQSRPYRLSRAIEVAYLGPLLELKFVAAPLRLALWAPV